MPSFKELSSRREKELQLASEGNLQEEEIKGQGQVQKSAVHHRPIVPLTQSKTYHITIKNNEFSPHYLKIEKGSIVEWKVCSSDYELNESSLYHLDSRSHVIAF